MSEIQVCDDCGAEIADGKDGCRKFFEELLARDFSDRRYFKVHRLIVDAYSLQHPDEYMVSGKSFAAHLTGVCLGVEITDPGELNEVVRKWLDGERAIEKPGNLPIKRGSLSVLHLKGAEGPEEHAKRVEEWAESVWEAWKDFQDLARSLVAKAYLFHENNSKPDQSGRSKIWTKYQLIKS